MTDLHPDQAYLPSLGTAADRIEEIAERLEQSRSTAESAAGEVTAAVWSGEGAQAFVLAQGDIDQPARSGCAGYVRLATAARDYQAAMQVLQDQGDDIRSRLATAEAERDDLRERLDDARAAALSGGGPTDTGTLDHLLILAKNRVTDALASLDDLKADRRRLDDETAQRMLDAPGAAAQAWVALAYAGDRSRPIDEVVAEVLDLARAANPSAEDYALIQQFLALYSGDAAVMAQFYRGLGPAGVTAFMATMSMENPQYLQSGAGSLAAGLRSGFAVASTTWNDAQAVQWGRGLTDAIADADPSQTDDIRCVSTFLLGATGLNPQVALGAFGRIEELRVHDPAMFDRVAPDGPPWTNADIEGAQFRFRTFTGGMLSEDGDLMGTIFRQLTQVPQLAREGFTDDTAIDYWFGDRNWAGDGFSGPAALVDAIVNDPATLVLRSTDPEGSQWADTVAFASLAAERLGGNVAYTAGNMSDRASLSVAKMLGAFMPEITGDIGIGADQGARTLEWQVKAIVNGDLVDVPAFTCNKGNLYRLLGVATVSVPAAAYYQARVGEYANSTLSYLTGPNHPDIDTAKSIANGLGGAFGMAYGLGAQEAARHAESISAEHREMLDRIAAIAGTIPGVETGRAGVDYLMQVASGQITTVGEALDPAIMSQRELDQMVKIGLNAGCASLDASVSSVLNRHWGQADPPYEETAATVIARAHSGFSMNGSSGQIGETTFDLNVVVLNPDGTTSEVARGDLP